MSTEMLQLAQLLTNHRLEVNKLESRISDLEKELNNHPQWISVEDELPSDTERLKESIVLVVSSTGVDMAFLRRPRLNDKYSVFLDEWHERVTHWIEPPTQEQGE